MEMDQLSRKLAVILHADVVGSTSLVRQDESLAHQRIQESFRSFANTIAKHSGTSHEIRGDALVAEFPKVSDAVAASIEFQNANSEYCRSLTDQIRPELRIGIAMGEVVIADNTLTGEGVVLAQRLEQLADTGGICIQGAAYETVPKRLPYKYEDLGELQLKGFDEPLRAYKVKTTNTIAKRHDEDQTSQTVVGLADKPSIAVLPFTNLSSDPEQEHFSDGITEDIITELSKRQDLLVIARNSTFVYNNKPVDIKQIGKDLEVRYVLEGSVRKAGSRLRVTAQLIDSVTGQHLWAERYDRDQEDVFEIQDDVMRQVVVSLDIKLLSGAQSQFWSDSTENLQAWQNYRTARGLFNSFSAENHHQVIELLSKAVEIDPGYSAAWVMMSGCYFHMEEHAGYSKQKRMEYAQLSRNAVKQAIEVDPSNGGALSMKAMHHLNSNEFDDAAEYVAKSVEMTPNDSTVLAMSAIVLNKCGQANLAMERIKKAIRLCPVSPTWYLHALGQISRALGDFETAINAYKELINRDPDSQEGHIGLAEILGEAGRIEEAYAAAREVTRINPNFSILEYVGNLSYRDTGEISKIAEGLRNARLPE